MSMLTTAILMGTRGDLSLQGISYSVLVAKREHPVTARVTGTSAYYNHTRDKVVGSITYNEWTNVVRIVVRNLITGRFAAMSEWEALGEDDDEALDDDQDWYWSDAKHNGKGFTNHGNFEDSLIAAMDLDSAFDGNCSPDTWDTDEQWGEEIDSTWELCDTVDDKTFELMLSQASSQDKRLQTAFGATPVYKTGYEDYTWERRLDEAHEELHPRLGEESRLPFRKETGRGRQDCTADHRQGITLSDLLGELEEIDGWTMDDPSCVSHTSPPKVAVVNQLAVRQARVKLLMRKGMSRTEAIEEVTQ